ncbi:unnamed protein product [Alopecurus aequalis]
MPLLLRRRPCRQIADMPSWNDGESSQGSYIGDDVENCGFVEWVDPEWHDSFEHALAQLWAKYQDTKDNLIEKDYNNAIMVHNISEEKKKVEKKYSSMLESMNKLAAESLKVQADTILQDVKVENANLKLQLESTREMQKCDQEVYMHKQREWNDERSKMKEEKKRLEYMLYDMLNINDVAKERLKKIKQICEE